MGISRPILQLVVRHLVGAFCRNIPFRQNLFLGGSGLEDLVLRGGLDHLALAMHVPMNLAMHVAMHLAMHWAMHLAMHLALHLAIFSSDAFGDASRRAFKKKLQKNEDHLAMHFAMVGRLRRI